MGSKRVSQQVKLLTGIFAAVVLFQNCTPNSLVIDEDLKQKTLSSKSLLLNSQNNPDAKFAHFTFVCPHDDSVKPKDLLRSGELKAVIEKFDFESNSTTILCEVHDVKKQILDTRTVDLSSCEEIPGPQNAHLDLYIVPEEINSAFKEHKINIDTAPLELGGYTLNYLTMSSEAKNASCDDAGAPLILQLSAQAPVVTLTAPTDGVNIDLLGGKSYKSSHDKVSASWLTPNSSDDAFILVKPNRDYLVLGANEMFADTTLGPDAKYAKQGFAALAKYDDNKDLLISIEDVVFGELRLWKDSNHDGQVQESELSTLAEQKVKAIDLSYVSSREADVYGNQIRNKSVIMMEDHSYGVIFDLWLRFIHNMPQPEVKAQSIPAPLSEKADASDSSETPESPALDPSPADTSSQTSEPHEEEPLTDSGPSLVEISE